MKRICFALPLVLALAPGCTNLDEVPSSAITPSTFFKNQREVIAGLAGVYAQLRSTTDNNDYYSLSEVTTDEMVVPTRGQDWYDNGTWLELHGQTWSPTSPGTGSFQNTAWNTAMAGVARANVLLDAMTRVHGVADSASIKAEARTLRAFYYYLLMDLFGGVPIVTDTAIQPRPRSTRAQLFQFIESELLAARADLPRTRDAGNNGRLTKSAVDAILANMYLNAGVFTKDTAGAGATQIKATAYNSCAGVLVAGGLDACQAAVNRADSIIGSGLYQLADTFAKNFRPDNNLSPENIFVVKFIDADGLGLNFVMRALHYSQFTPEPWNGFAALTQTYNAFDSLDQRRKIFLVGLQKNVETGVDVCERPGCAKGAPRLNFTPGIANVTKATEGEGARIYKWPADPKHVAQNNGNDFAYFRLAEMMMIKAEAKLEGATGTSTPLALLQAVRARSVPQPDTLSVVNRAVILRERLFELTAEAKRRQDLIRHGQYTQAWQFKAAGAAHLVLMPIPHTQIDANPMLTQNPGYP
jgi:starch-binding outer membrane protein, SusD/RagB family